MLIKSYIAENNIEVLNKNLNLFYGENLGMKNDFRKKIKSWNFWKKLLYELTTNI